MKKIYLFLTLGIFLLCGANTAFAGNTDLSGVWFLNNTYPAVTAQVNEADTCSGNKSYTEGISIPWSISLWMNQSADGTILYSEHATVDNANRTGFDHSVDYSISINGKVTGKLLNFNCTRVITNTANEVVTITESYAGSRTKDAVSGTLAGTYHKVIKTNTGGCARQRTYNAPFSGTFNMPAEIIDFPDTFIDFGPQGTINRRTVSFSWHGIADDREGGVTGYYYQLDSQPKVFIAVTEVELKGLAEGPHTFAVAAQDGTGSVDSTPASRDFTVEAVKPPEPPKDARFGRSTDLAAYPVNLTTGNMYVIVPEFTMPGKGINFSFIRAYNSQENVSGPLGYGWTHSYNVYLYFIPEDASGNTIKIKDEEGKGYIFIYDPDEKVCLPQRGEYSTLIGNSTAATWTKKDGRQYIFSLPSGRLTEIKDRNGNSVKLTYNAQNQMSTITDTAGRKINFTYDAKGRITRMADPLNRTFAYDYDAPGNLVNVTDAAGNRTTYEYDTQHNLTRILDASGKSDYFTYDTSDRCASSSKENNLNRAAFGYDAPNKKTSVTDSKNNTAVYSYNDDSLITKTVDPQGGETFFSWDKAMNLLSRTDARGNITKMEYDTKGNLTKITDPLKNITAFEYEPNFNLIKTLTDAQNNKTVYAYDVKGNLTKVTDGLGNNTTNTYNAAGQIIGSQNALGKTTTYTYDAQGNLTQLKDAAGAVIAYAYDAVGNRTQIKDARGNATNYAYDNLNRLFKIIYTDNSTVLYAYDPVGNRITVTDALGNITRTSYDQGRRVKSATNALGRVTNYDYDTEGNMVAVTDANNNKTVFEYDPLNRLIWQTDALGNKTQYQYDAVGNRIGITDAKGQTTNYEYDPLGRLTSLRGSAAGATEAISYTYDSLGRRLTMVDAHGATTYAYDKLGRLVQVDGPQTKDALAYTYDVLGNRLTMVDADTKTTKYAYDVTNRLISITDPQNKVATYTYDAAGNPVTLTYPNNTKAAYTYDNLNRLTKITQQQTVSPNTKLGEYTYTYDKAGKRTKAVLSDAGSIVYVYDPLGELTQETKTGGTGPYSVTYSYDPAGNRVKMVDRAGEHNYSYNSLNQLIQEDVTSAASVTKDITVSGTVSDPGGVKSVTVNSKAATLQGNNFSCVIALNKGVNTITVVATDNLGNTTTKTIKAAYTPGLQRNFYSYDANGSLVREQLGTGVPVTRNYSYDSLSRLIRFNAPGLEETYLYDGDGKRISSTSNFVTSTFIYDGTNVILERNSSGAAMASYLRNPLAMGGVGGIISLTSASSGLQYYYYDGSGSVTGLSGSTGVKTQTYTYDAFGNLLNQSGSVVNQHRFLTKQTDPTGLVYFGQRYYDPRIGRWTSVDPQGTGAAANLYTYAGNNPVNLIDLD